MPGLNIIWITPKQASGLNTNASHQFRVSDLRPSTGSTLLTTGHYVCSGFNWRVIRSAMADPSSLRFAVASGGGRQGVNFGFQILDLRLVRLCSPEVTTFAQVSTGGSSGR
jgi:hypothetical protein